MLELFISWCIITAVNGAQTAVFLIPFEISFDDINQFSFTIHHLQNFIDSSSTFFDVDHKNISIAFVKEIASTDHIDLGFTVSTNRFEDENRIRNINIDSYRSHLITSNNLPQIIGMEIKHESCSNGKYSTFYHYDCECQWLCDHLSIYHNATNECDPISNISSVLYITETNTKRFIYIGYGFSSLITIFCCVIYFLKQYLQKQNDGNESKPSMQKREYLYDDDDDSNAVDNKKKDTKDIQAEDIALSVKSTRSNSVECDEKTVQNGSENKEERIEEDEQEKSKQAEGIQGKNNPDSEKESCEDNISKNEKTET